MELSKLRICFRAGFSGVKSGRLRDEDEDEDFSSLLNVAQTGIISSLC